MSDQLGGVYVVALSTDITGEENIAWCFRDEADADDVVRLLEHTEGEGRAWQTFEPISYSLIDDPDAVDYFTNRTGLSADQLKRALTSITENDDEALQAVLAEAGYAEEVS